ncbi:tigger transposable element-derived protein 4-like [Dermacentor albipictus]|uniref:tigger transposable element-derived protein 4-like n=1 Tax=Dermacentor albipictus TaxID=60249 RepID=UPI0038FC93FB
MAPTPSSSSSPMASKRGKQYRRLTMKKKAAIIKQVVSGRSQADVSKEFGISKQTVSDFLKNKDKILEAAEKPSGAQKKNASQGVHPKLEEALVVWLNSMTAKRLPVSGCILKEKAETLAVQMNIEDFKFSDGWLRNFKHRNDLKFKKMCGESGAVDSAVIEQYRNGKLQSLLQQFSADNVFNCDETGLFYKMLPERTLAFAGDPCHGGKHSKERLTVLVGSNMSGSEKLPLLVIGKSKNPRCFKGATLPVLYEANKKAWVTQQLFESYVRRLDRKFELQNRRVVLCIDNCAAHGHIKNLKAVQLEFMPPNTTAVLQPMDQGVIRNLKLLYRSRVLNRMVLCAENAKGYNVDLRSAVGMLADAWKAVTQDTIRNCFRHAGFVLATEEPDLPESNNTIDVCPPMDDVINDLRSAGVSIPTEITFKQFVDADNELDFCAELTDEEIVRAVKDQAATLQP